MPADITKAKDFLLTTDFPLDQIIYLKSDSYPVAGFGNPGSIGTISVPHSLGTIPLGNMIWSMDEDFTTSYMVGSSPNPDDITRSNVGVEVSVYASSTDIVIGFSNFLNAGFTFYYRVYAFEQSNSTLDFAPTASSSSDFIINTDFNYTKLYIDEEQPIVGTATITHNLGYIPQTEAFIELPQDISNPRRIQPPTQFSNVLNYSTLSPGNNLGFKVTTIDMSYEPVGLPLPDVFHARIYLDE